jgi:hypothetical protein
MVKLLSIVYLFAKKKSRVCQLRASEAALSAGSALGPRFISFASVPDQTCWQGDGVIAVRAVLDQLFEVIEPEPCLLAKSPILAQSDGQLLNLSNVKGLYQDNHPIQEPHGFD